MNTRKASLVVRHTNYFLLLILLSTINPILAIEKYSSRSFMFTRPAAHNLAEEFAVWHHYMHEKNGPVQACAQVIPFYQATTSVYCFNDARSARYFLPYCKTELLVTGDAVAPVLVPRDVRAEWLGINNPHFYGKMSIAPQQKQYGAIFEYQQDLSAFTDIKFFEPFWVSIMLPFVVVKNDPALRQYDVMNPNFSGGPTDIIEAFNQGAWRFSHITTCEQRRSGLAEFKAKLGVDFATRKDAEVVLYTICSLPTAPKQCARDLFSPFVGNNGHFTYGTGVAFQVPFSAEWDTKQFFWFAEAEHLYMFGNEQERTFDLKGKPWSRFLLFNSIDGLQTNVPGVNILTRRVHAKPDSFVDFVTGFRTRWNDALEVELGYNLWAHGNERINALQTWCNECDEDISIGLFGIAGTEPGTSASESSIAFRAPNDSSFVPLNLSDIDIDSAVAGCAITHKIHGSIGYGYSGERFAGFIAFGGFYEGIQNDAALQQWGIWGKIGANF